MDVLVTQYQAEFKKGLFNTHNTMPLTINRFLVNIELIY